MFKLINFIGFQACWWLLILFEDQYWWAVAGLLVAHVFFVRSSAVELAVVAVVALTGVVIDSLLALSGVYIFSGAGQFLPIPMWLIVLWLAFASTIRHSLAYLSEHYVLAAFLGAVGGTLSYIGGMKLGAVAFGHGFYATVILLGGIWACLMPVIFLLSQRVEAVTERLIGNDTFQITKEKL
ncbi:DUF2878 domain-containing protein [uncultured Alteromonas sp.]|uniref:DUF2878 domain-containing protein n=1 Tax=uncultured Alteromonas sp. TaxID=179113 RepID=UPI0025E7141E|nr:DUF2878 domain-containing protein [uncultured Alteromonas sp.]